MITFYPLNDLAITVSLQDINPTTGVVSPLTTGTVRAFISNTYSPLAEPAAPTLEVQATHLDNPAGTWLIFFDAAVLTPALLASLFVEDIPYLIVEQTGGVRAYAEMLYMVSRAATVVG